MRRVKVFKHGPWDATLKSCQRVDDGLAYFHSFGVDYEEFENGPGNFSVAIIERDDGKVEMVQVYMIEFIDKP